MSLREKRILITGGSGLVGQHLQAELAARGCSDIFAPRSAECDFRKPDDVERTFAWCKPQIVFNLAAKVGGILDNQTYPADFYFENILIGAYTIEACARHRCEVAISLGAGCGYPLKLKEPLREEEFFDGLPQPESAPYSYAKKMLIVQGLAYRRQYGLRSIVLIPSNLYGAHDNFNLSQAHVLPALIRKFYEATRDRAAQVEIWGDGSAKRDFVHAADVAVGMCDAALHYEGEMPLNLAMGHQSSVREVADLLYTISGYRGEILWNTTKPSGQKSREFSMENLRKHLPQFRPQIDLKAGLERTYAWFAENYDSGKVRL
jgi:GDP-L-fucose synthase